MPRAKMTVTALHRPSSLEEVPYNAPAFKTTLESAGRATLFSAGRAEAMKPLKAMARKADFMMLVRVLSPMGYVGAGSK